MRIIFILICLVFSQLAYSQLKGAVPQANAPAHMNKERKVTSNTPASTAKINADKLTKSLKLNEKQHRDLHDALLEYETNVAKTNKSNLSKKEKFNAINKINQKRQSSIKAILTPEQYKTYIYSFP